MDRSDRPLPTWIGTAYETLIPHILNSETAISPADAEQILLEKTDEDMAVKPADAAYAV